METSDKWLKIKDDFERAGKTVRLLAKEYGLSHTAIAKRQRSEGWRREVAATETRRFRAVVSSRAIEVTTRSGADDLVEKGNDLAARMLDELDATTTRQGELTQMIGEACDGDDSAAKHDAMMRAVSLPSRAMTLRNLSAVIKTLAEAKAPKGKKAAAHEAAMISTGSGLDELLSRVQGRLN